MRALVRTTLVGCFGALTALVACNSGEETAATDTSVGRGRGGDNAGVAGTDAGTAGSFQAAGTAGASAQAGESGAGGELDGLGPDGEGEGAGAGGDGLGGAETGGGGEAGSLDPGTAGTAGADAGAAGAGEGAGAGAGDAGGSTGTGGAAGTAAGTPECECFLTTATCGTAALDQATKKACHLTIPAGSKNDLLSCPNGKAGAVAVKKDCTDGCTVVAGDTADTCTPPPPPACPCFASAGYCGAAVLKEAEKRGCKASIPAGSSDDVLYCPKGESGSFVVKETCKDGCVAAPSGQIDYCKATTTPATYKFPIACGTTGTCSNGNHTSSHDGKDEYAYDFAMPIGTSVRAMRGGTVLATRFVSPPGSACSNGGGSSCANFANTIEIKHSDGSVGLYMHVSKILVSKGQTIKQGQEIAKSGNSGYSTGPHTHVQVQAACGIWWCQSKAFSFGEGSMSAGVSRKSQNCP
jgi:hypothetical protein